MEQLNLTAAKDNERIYKILGDLMNGDKEFQIMITVPSAKTDSNRTVPEQPKQKEVVRDLEQDVTDMIHEIGVPAHIKGYQYLREAIILAVNDSKALPDDAEQGREGDPPCDRGCVEQGQDGDAGRAFRLHH